MSSTLNQESGAGVWQKMSDRLGIGSRGVRLPATISMVLLLFASCGDQPKPPVNSVPPSATPVATPALSRKVSSADVVKAFVPDAEINSGGSAQADVRLTISQGYHVNANPPTFSYLIATAVEPVQSKGITIGKPAYPTPITKKFSFAEKPLDVYEGETTIKLPLQAAGNAERGARVIPMTLRIQACDHEVCYAPATIDLALNLKVK